MTRLLGGIPKVASASGPFFFLKHPLLLLFLLFLLFSTPLQAQTDWVTLFQDNFENGILPDWNIWNSDWTIGLEETNQVLNGSVSDGGSPTWVRNQNGYNWTNYSVKMRIKLVTGQISLLFRISNILHDMACYSLAFGETFVSLNKSLNYTGYELGRYEAPNDLNTWHDVEIIGIEGNLKIFVNGSLRIEYTDPDPILNGTIGFGTFSGCHVRVDDVLVTGKLPELLAGYKWMKTGGPPGGLGYDIRIHPTNKDLMFVTDNPSGVNKSFDGGKSWIQKNSGIDIRAQGTSDVIPIFSLTIDPKDPNIVWAGTQNTNGIFKSTDGGETWVKKNNGINDYTTDISFRGFGVHPQNSNIVFAGAEISTGIQGRKFALTKGKIFKTTDGGGNWRCVWEGDNLVRFVLFDYSNPNILYASTGIWDREAFNTVGVGVLKSYDGGETWAPSNTGLNDLYVGFLEMHPTNPQILYASTGMNVYFNKPGVYKTIDGGTTWVQMLESSDAATIVTISPSNPEVVYAGGGSFYRSDNGGISWIQSDNGWNMWGPPGFEPGVPISAVVDPDDPMTVFVNNYKGGNVKSNDGGMTWVDSSRGYTGVHLHSITVSKSRSNKVYTVGRSGPFKSEDYGQNWMGISYHPATAPEWNTITVNPSNDQELLLADERDGHIFKSSDGGNSWHTVADVLSADVKNQCTLVDLCHGFKAMAYTPSNPSTIYAGMRRDRNGEGSYVTASFGMFKSTDGGETWFEINNGLRTSLININCVAVHPNNHNIVYAGTLRDGIFKTTDGGQNWVNKSNGLASADVRSLAIDPKNPELVYAGLNEGVGLFKTTNGGELWENINTGITLNCPSYLLPTGGVKQGMTLEKPPLISRSLDYSFVPWTSIWGLAIDPGDSQTIYAGDYSSGVYISKDAGANWTPINDGLTTRVVTAIDISSNGRHLYASTVGGGVYYLRTPGCCDVFLPLIFKN